MGNYCSKALFEWDPHFVFLDVKAIQAKTKSKVRDFKRHAFYVLPINMFKSILKKFPCDEKPKYKD